MAATQAGKAEVVQATGSRKPTVQVRAKVAHTQPGSLTYREKGDEFSHIGEPYEHVELVKRPQPADEADDLDGE